MEGPRCPWAEPGLEAADPLASLPRAPPPPLRRGPLWVPRPDLPGGPARCRLLCAPIWGYPLPFIFLSRRFALASLGHGQLHGVSNLFLFGHGGWVPPLSEGLLWSSRSTHLLFAVLAPGRATGQGSLRGRLLVG